jgi:hypothetical protein
MVQRGSGRINGREFMESVSELYDHYCTQIKVCDAVMVIPPPTCLW